MFGCCSLTLANKQPETINGSPESILDRGVKRAARITGSWAEEIAEAVEGLDTEKAIRRALRRIEKELDVQELEGALAEADLHASLLGALDSHYEAETEDVVAPVRFHRTEFLWLLAEELPNKFGGSFASRGIDQAVGAFNRLEVLRVQSLRDAYEQLDQAAIRHAFWVSGETKKAMLQTVRKELERQVSKGSDLGTFRKFVKARLEAAGWTPKNKSHVETVFRTNVLRAYNAGRATQMQHPTVLALRPYWRIVGVKDNRTRANHRRIQGWELYASDEAWRSAYPPFGFNCRERITSKRTATNLHDGSELLRYVPDPGFRSGLKGLVAPPGPRPPKNHPRLTPEVKRPKALPLPKPPKDIGQALRSALAMQETPGQMRDMATSPMRDLLGGQHLTNAKVRVTNLEPDIFKTVVKSTEVEVMQRTYDLKTKTVTHDLLFLEKEFQNQTGLGLKLVKDQAEAYERMGIKKIELDAAHVGRYVWPSLGFRPPAKAEKALIKAFREWAAAQGVEIPASVDTAPKVANFRIGADRIGKEYLLRDSKSLVEGYSASPKTVLENLRKRGR